VHCAHTANARSPRASNAVTRIPPVLTCVQVWPPSWVANNSGPNAQPSSVSRKRIWLTPADPSGAPVTGARTPYQVAPPLSVRAIDVQSCLMMGQWPGVPAWPSTHPVCVPIKVTDVAAKLAGTGAGPTAGVGVSAAVDGAGDPWVGAGGGGGALGAPLVARAGARCRGRG